MDTQYTTIWDGDINQPHRGYLCTEPDITRAPDPDPAPAPLSRKYARARHARMTKRLDAGRSALREKPSTSVQLEQRLALDRYAVRRLLAILQQETPCTLCCRTITVPHCYKRVRQWWIET